MKASARLCVSIFSGLLYKSNVIFYDHQTESLWSQLMGKAIAGPLAGTPMEEIPSNRMKWESWREMHPDNIEMNLKEKIQEKKAQSSAPKEVREVIGRAIKNLRESGIVDRALKGGDRAPDFTLPSARGESVNLKEKLSSGPVVLGFYRGRW